MSAPNNRLLALDVIRGITIAGMILVNNPVPGSLSMPRCNTHDGMD